MSAVQAEASERGKQDQYRNQQVIRLRRPSCQTNRSQNNGEQRSGAANRRNLGTDNTGRDDGPVAHGTQDLGADG
jgi:hypothetical protein